MMPKAQGVVIEIVQTAETHVRVSGVFDVAFPATWKGTQPAHDTLKVETEMAIRNVLRQHVRPMTRQ
jgi:hypothetical protein